ncbi:MAG: OmpA family protein [Bacteroidaceae bacterium]
MKKMFTVLAAALVVGSASAQNEKNNPNYTEKWNDNIFVSVGAGASVGLRDANYGNGFWRAVNPTFNVALGKYINPLWSYRLQGNGSWRMSLRDAKTGIRDKQEYFNVGVDAIYNLTNAFLGYNPDKKIEVSAFAGPYSNFTIGNGIGGWHPGVTAGMQLKYNFCKFLSVDLEGRMNGNRDINTRVADTWYPELSVGISYVFGGKEFKNDAKSYELCMAEQKSLNDQINADKNQISDLQNQLAAAKRVKPAPVQQVITKDCDPTAGPIAVFFQIGKSKIDARGNASIELAAKAIKADPSGKYSITGYADKATGSAKLNQKLSEKRAKAVSDALIAAGVDASQLDKQGLGAQDNMFSTNALNRVVIVKRK